MLLAQQFARATILAVDLNARGNVTAYAAQKEGGQLVAIFNKAEIISFDVSIKSDSHSAKAEAWPPTAAGLDSTTGITLGGASVTGLE